PANRRALKAQAAQYRAGVAGAELDISRTDLTVPFDMRIRSVNVSPSELVTVGTVLAEGDGINVAEVPAQMSIGSLGPLIQGSRPPGETVSTRAMNRMPTASLLQATIRLESGSVTAQWEAEVDRFESVDSETRTVGVVVSVDKPFERAIPGVQPPLVRGMYVEVELRGRPREGCRAVPRAALHGKQVYLVNAEQRLEIRPVEVAFVQDTYACIATGLEPGESLVLTRLVPAIEGMLLVPKVDEMAATGLAAQVQGEDLQVTGAEG
ncbi:MAG: efflux RND transporter periplasmic adaptor subunit, partial [Nannocystaceae bacterium]